MPHLFHLRRARTGHLRANVELLFASGFALLAAAMILLRVGASQAAPPHPAAQLQHRSAELARALSVKETAKLLPIGSVGVKVKERGSAVGTIPGSASSNLNMSGNNISGTFVLAAHGGTIEGHTAASIVGQAAVPVVRLAGTLSVTGGTGRYAHASGRLSIRGTLRRRNFELVEEASGTLRY